MNEICLSCKKHTKCGRAKHETIGCGYYVPLTEQEYIQTCDTEQLADFLADACAWAIEEQRCYKHTEKSTATFWKQWLKEKYQPCNTL